MEQQNYQNEIEVSAGAAEAFSAIANVDGWWAKTFIGSAFAAGDTFRVQFGDTWVVFKITEAIPDQKSTWTVTDCHLPWLNNITEWTGTAIEWLITAKNNKTLIQMTHIGLVPEAECYDSCNSGWNRHITGSLYNLLTMGEGQPQ